MLSKISDFFQWIYKDCWYILQYYGGPQVSCHHFSFEFDKTFFMQQNLIFGTQVIIFWPWLILSLQHKTLYHMTKFFFVTKLFVMTKFFLVTKLFVMTKFFLVTKLFVMTNFFLVTKLFVMTNFFLVTKLFVMTKFFLVTKLFVMTKIFSRDKFGQAKKTSWRFFPENIFAKINSANKKWLHKLHMESVYTKNHAILIAKSPWTQARMWRLNLFA